MRVDTVKGWAFGPFAGDTLELGRGLNVIYGPNESGKSSWHAAIYVALCGMRRSRGQPTREDRAFANRHRPWRGTTWRVSALLTLDDGRTIELDQRLGSGGRSTAIDTKTKKPVADGVVRDGSVDAATLLGLTRETALATLFVRQADMLRILTDAGALQEYLERAAASTTVETTADAALARIAAYKREHVGVLRSGSRGPLAVATRTLERARAALDDAHDHYERYQQLMARRREADTVVSAAERELARLSEHERRRQQLDEWSAIRAIERRLEQAQQLRVQIEEGKSTPRPDRELAQRITRALAQYESRPSMPAPLEGPTLDDLEAALAALPTVPDGDHEPNTDVISRRDELHACRQRHSAHPANRPDEPVPQSEDDSAAALDAEIAELPLAPAGDVEPAAEVTAARDSWHRDVQRLAGHDANRPAEPASMTDAKAETESAETLELHLAQLPTTPIGDVEPSPEVTEHLGDWRRACERLLAHASTKPSVDTGPLPVASSELRRLADELDAPVPVVDESLRSEVERRRVSTRTATLETADARAPASRPATIPIGVGAGVAAVGVLMLALGAVVPGAGGLLLGVSLIVVGLVLRSRSRPAATAGLRTSNSATDVELPRLEARLLLEEEAVAQAHRRRASALTRVQELQLPATSEDLRQLASTSDSLHHEQARVAEWEHRNGDLEAARASAESELIRVLAVHGTAPEEGEDLDGTYQRYVGACRERARQAGQAARRADLEARLQQRREADAARLAELERCAEWERRRGDLEAACASAESELTSVLAVHGTAPEEGEDLDGTYQRYVGACRERARQAGQAARRADLEARLQQRREADLARQAELERCAEWERRRGELEAAISAAEEELTSVLTVHGTAPDEGEDLDGTYQRYVDACRERAGQVAQAGRRDDLVGRLNERRSAEDARAKELATRIAAEDLLAAVAAEAGYTGSQSAQPEQVEVHLRDWLSSNDLREAQERQHEESIARLDQLLDGISIDELATGIAERVATAGDPPAADGEHLEDQGGALLRQRQEVQRARDHVAELAGQIEAAGSQLFDVSAAIEAEARAEAELGRLMTLAEDLDRASAILEEAQQKVHADIAPVLNETVRPWVPRITGGRYDDIRVDPATLEIEVREAGGGPYRAATVLSHGTTEQLFLLLRLALAQHLATTGETAPIVLDDVTVQSDATRTVAVLDLLRELSGERQVVLFSQEDEVLRWAEANLDSDSDRLIRLAR